MTYAAQVRSVSKSVLSQPIEEDFYDINSLRIICKYFVGSIVTVKTADAVIEGVLHTISHNKICITLVTIAKANSPEIITEIASNKIVNLNDVLFISANDSDKPEVTVKGKYFKVDQEIKINNDCKKQNQKSSAKITNGKLCNKKSKAPKPSETTDGNAHQPNCSTSNDGDIKPTETLLETATKPVETSEIKEPKKTFSFNPNAPEFKPRSNILFSDTVNGHVLFSPHAQQFPSVFTPNSAPAIFVPNIFFYAPNQQPMPPPPGMDNCSFDSTATSTGNHSDTASDIVSHSKPIDIDEPFARKSITEMHIANPTISFPQMMPIFPPLPIFVPNHSFNFNPVPFGKTIEINSASGPETSTSKVVDDAKSNESVDNDELSNPSNWPPLPLPVNQLPNHLDNQK